ncbi:hypothetical protein C2S53_004047 [Perilla frutescens var. hirtella]|uniref:Uncharacterized protein n=1 Tax=Perilla frutescens var. hirtella TaxID=608512 RepID=A0AAD4P2T2_PERFH|nr:hypothetical protein C2S53_004047 [Perilla frutescens var. hirtella]
MWWHQSYDSRYASLVKIAESLNYRAPLYNTILRVLDILGNEIVEQDVVIVFNNWSNTERDGNVMITSTVMVALYNGVGNVEVSWSLINHFMMLSTFEDAHKVGDDMDKMLIGWLIARYSFEPKFKMGNIWRHSDDLWTIVCALWNIFLGNILHHRGRALVQWAEKSQSQTIAKIHMLNDGVQLLRMMELDG